MKPFLMKLNTLLLLSIVVAFLFAELGYCQDAEVAKFPNRPITFIVPVPPGGPTDLAIRLITKEAEKYLKQPIVIVNKPGAALTIGTAAIATSKPDGYTIGYSGGPQLSYTPSGKGSLRPAKGFYSDHAMWRFQLRGIRQGGFSFQRL